MSNYERPGSESEGSTAPFTPESFADDVTNPNQRDVFAWLHPHSKTACAAYDAAVNTCIKNPDKHKHARQFMSANDRARRAESVFTEDGKTAEFTHPQWSGAFKLSLKVLPNDPAAGWYLGTNRGRPPGEVDLLLAPPTNAWTAAKVAGKHARLFFHKDTWRLMLEARHTVTMGKGGASVVRGSAPRVLEDGELIEISDCSYIFEYSDLYPTQGFEQDLAKFIKQHQGSDFSLNKYLSPCRTSEPVSVGEYSCSPSAFAQGTFGKVSAGWARDGTAVAIKVFKSPAKERFRSHQLIMESIGEHANIVKLMDCKAHFDTEVPDAYCVYSPLAVTTLAHLLGAYNVDLPGQITLFADFLNGLSYLHEHGIMHRDINPNNLAVTSLDDPKGIIIDLDSATREVASTDHQQGTIPFLAPEIMLLKSRLSSIPYDKSVDTWAVALSMWTLFSGQPFRWTAFGPAHPEWCGLVTPEAHREFHRRLIAKQANTSDAYTVGLLIQIREMTEYDSRKRGTSSWALAIVQALKDPNYNGRIVLKSGRKRRLEDAT